jgi:hypothetical protein
MVFVHENDKFSVTLRAFYGTVLETSSSTCQHLISDISGIQRHFHIESGYFKTERRPNEEKGCLGFVHYHDVVFGFNKVSAELTSRSAKRKRSVARRRFVNFRRSNKDKRICLKMINSNLFCKS